MKFGTNRRSRWMSSRRAFGKLLAGTGLCLASFPMGAARAASQGQATFYAWEGFDDPALYSAHVEANGALPLVQTFSDEQEAFDNLSAGMPADLAHPCADTLPHWRDAGILQPIDVSRLSNWGNLLEPLRRIPGVNDDEQTWFVPFDWGLTSIAYRSDLVNIGEQSYSLLWDERYAGKLAFGEDATESVIMAALAAGVADPFNMSDEELARVRDLLIRQRDLLKYYWSDETVISEGLRSGDIVASSCWSNTFLALKQEGVAVEFLNPKEGILSWCCGIVLLKSAEHLDQAYAVMDALIGPGVGTWFLERQMSHSNPNSGASSVGGGSLLSAEELLSKSVFLRVSPRMEDYQQMFDEVREIS